MWFYTNTSSSKSFPIIIPNISANIIINKVVRTNPDLRQANHSSHQTGCSLSVEVSWLQSFGKNDQVLRLLWSDLHPNKSPLHLFGFHPLSSSPPPSSISSTSPPSRPHSISVGTVCYSWVAVLSSSPLVPLWGGTASQHIHTRLESRMSHTHMQTHKKAQGTHTEEQRYN